MRFGERLRSGWWKTRVEDEVDAELEFHVEMRARELVGRGMQPADARQEAMRRFGDIKQVNATCRDLGRLRDRDMRRTEYLSEMRQDIVFACRQLLKNPGFTVVAVLTLALGIGATTAIFSAVQAVVLRPLPFSEPDRITAIYEDFHGRAGNVSAGNYVDGIEPARSFSATTAIQYSSFNISDAGEPERIIGARATWEFFNVFAMSPQLGRVFSSAEDRPGRATVVVLSNRLWTRRFGADPTILGRRINLNGAPHDIIGVMPAAFDFTMLSEELWVPIAFTDERKAEHDEHYLQVYGRLLPGVSADAARSELQAAAMRLRTDFPEDNPVLSFTTMTALEELVGDYRRRLLTMLGAVAFVLLIACGNIANLLLARGAVRSGELAVRAALGAGRGRIARQLLTESLVLAAIAAAAGLALASWGIRALVAAAPQGVPRLEQTAIDPVVLAFCIGIAVVCALLFGLAPAMRAAKADVQSILKEGGRSAGLGGVRDRLRTTLIAAELALALLLLVGAGLLIRSSLALQRVDTGFNPSGVLSARLSLPATQYSDPAHTALTFARLAEAAARVPGVERAGITSQVPMGGGGNGNGLIPEGKPFDLKNAIQSRLRIVTPGYLDAMGIPVVRGRDLNDGDRAGSMKVMLISESLAAAAFPDQDPIGKRIACCEPGPDGTGPSYKAVVGVVRDVRWRGPGEPPAPEFYLPLDQVPAAAWTWLQNTMYVVVRTSLEPASLSAGLRSAAKDIAPGVPLFNMRTMEERLADSLAAARFNTLLLSLLGAIGLVLAAVGIYGVIGYFVTRRTREIGVRMALGASRGSVIALVVRQAAWPVGGGIAIGLIAAALLTRVLTTELVGVSAGDPLTFVAVAGILATVALVASLVPARRAASVDPTRALQTQ